MIGVAVGVGEGITEVAIVHRQVSGGVLLVPVIGGMIIERVVTVAVAAVVGVGVVGVVV